LARAVLLSFFKTSLITAPTRIFTIYAIRRSLRQFVSFNDRAWHAGRSIFDGVEECNDYSIGVELEGTDELAYTESQYLSLSKLTRLLMIEFPSIRSSRITGHSDVAPGRKTDPGPAFDWDKLHASLK